MYARGFAGSWPNSERTSECVSPTDAKHRVSGAAARGLPSSHPLRRWNNEEGSFAGCGAARMSASEPNSSAPSPMIIASPRVEGPPETPGRRGPERRKWPQHSSEPSALTVDFPPAISTPLSGERRSSVGELLDMESRQACSRSRSPQAPHSLRQAGAPSGVGLTIECSPRLSRRAPAAPGPRHTALALTVVRCCAAARASKA